MNTTQVFGADLTSDGTVWGTAYRRRGSPRNYFPFSWKREEGFTYVASPSSQRLYPLKANRHGDLITSTSPTYPTATAAYYFGQMLNPSNLSVRLWSDLNDWGEFIGYANHPPYSYQLLWTDVATSFTHLPSFSWTFQSPLPTPFLEFFQGNDEPFLDWIYGPDGFRPYDDVFSHYEGYMGWTEAQYEQSQFRFLAPPQFINEWGDFVASYSFGIGNNYGGGFDQNGNYLYDGEFTFLDSGTPVDIDDERMIAFRNSPTQFSLSRDGATINVTDFGFSLNTSDTIRNLKMAPKGMFALQVARTNNTQYLILATREQDADRDGMSDDWEDYYFGIASEAKNNPGNVHADPDGDGVSTLREYYNRTNPTAADPTDANGRPIDIRPGIDSDGDGLPNSWEVYHGLDPFDPADASLDSDGDGLSNSEEFQLGTHPALKDSDGDRVDDNQELAYGLDPTNADTDGDGRNDGEAVASPPILLGEGFNTGITKWWDNTGDEDVRKWFEASEELGSADDFDGFYGRHLADLQPSPSSYWSAAAQGWTIPDVASSELPQVLDFEYNYSSGHLFAQVLGLARYPMAIAHENKFETDVFDRFLSQGQAAYTTQVLQLWREFPVPEEISKTYLCLVFRAPSSGTVANGVWPGQLENWELMGQVTGTQTPGIDGSGAVTLKIPADSKSSEQFLLQTPRQFGFHVFSILLPVEVVPDFDRDGMITSADRGQISEENPWRFWRNSDDDSGTEGGDDIPSADDPDYQSSSVDGVRDLVDFFPVHFDLKSVLEVLPETEYQYFVKHESQSFYLGGALPVPSFNVLWYPEADLEADPSSETGVGSYLKNLTRAQDIAGRSSNTIPQNGLQIPEEMLIAAKDGKGVALFESRHPTDKPIVIEIRKNYGTSVAESEMPVRILEVESMFRSKFLNENLGGGTQGGVPAEPGNWPDADRNGKHFIFVHGYNVSGEQARGWNSEMFKRMFWSGSDAMFTGVAWHGNESQMGTATPDYWRNVHNAFQTSKSVADFVNALPGSGKCIAAHSLGNIVVSSAIKDHGLSVANYYMVDAAAAIEAYSLASTLGNAEMSHPDWRAYDEKLWCSEWHEIFPETDNRSKMTWRDRFGAFPNAYNFHSTGEEVLKNGDGTVPGTIGVATSGGVRAWVKNEMSKGFSIGTGGGLFHNGTGGWDFNSHWNVEIYSPYGGGGTRRRTPAEAATIPIASLEENPFFDPFVNDKFHDPALGSAEAAKYDEVSKALAESIPALTFAAGSNPIQIFNTRNFDMMTLKNGWPPTRVKIIEGTELTDWRHSDLRNIAYIYTRKVFDKFVELGGLDQ